MLTDEPLRDLLAAFSSPDPTPGGGSASALASAIGVSLLSMVAGLPRTRSGSDEDRTALQRVKVELDDLQRQLIEAVDADANAYGQVLAAFRLPRAAGSGAEARRAAIQDATLAATRVPLSVVQLSASALVRARTVAAHGNRAAASDVGTAIALLRAGLEGAHLNVVTNLGGLKDQTLVETLRAEAERLAAQAGRAAEEAQRSLQADPG